MIDPGFTTVEMSAVFTSAERVRSLLRVEATLARSQAIDGVIPAAAADEIERVCAAEYLDPEQLLVDGWEQGTPVLPLLDYLRGNLSAESAAHLHYLATTQDIVDTAMMLQLQRTFSHLDQLACSAGRALQQQQAFRSTPIMTRTFLQPAEASSYDLRLAHWLSPLTDAIEVLRSQTFPLQFGGAIGDRFGQKWTLTMANQLFLHPRFVPWHTDRTPVIDLMQAMAQLVRWAAKVANDLVLLASNGEVAMRAGGSTAMAHKRNPIDGIRSLAAAQSFHALANAITTSGPHELERASGAWHAEWFAIPLIAQTAAATVDAVGRALASLTIAPADVVVPPGRAESATELARVVFERANPILSTQHPYTKEENERLTA
jgi:3-carboxy-cis,cis-muconate cycloisomerase